MEDKKSDKMTESTSIEAVLTDEEKKQFDDSHKKVIEKEKESENKKGEKQ